MLVHVTYTLSSYCYTVAGLPGAADGVDGRGLLCAQVILLYYNIDSSGSSCCYV